MGKQKKTGIISTTAGICLLLGLLLGCGGSSGEKEYRKALHFWEEGNLGRARAMMDTAIRKRSGSENKSVAKNQLGIILWQLDETDKAITEFTESCRLASPKVTEANLNLAIAFFHVSRMEEAEVHLNHFLKEQPTNQMALTYKSLLDLKKQDWNAAETQINEVLSQNPRDPASLNILAITELNNNRSETAVTRLKNIISTNPSYAPASYNLAVIYDTKMHNDKMALSWYRDYLQKADPSASYVPLAKRAIDRLSNTYGSLNRNVEMAKRYFAEGAALQNNKKYAQAVEKYRQAVQADPSQRNAFYNMGICYATTKDYREASKACTSALQLDEHYIPARYMLAYSLSKEGKMEESEREVKIVLSQDPNHSNGKILLKYIQDSR